MSHYETLGLPQNASKEEIKKAYRQLSMKYHPDRNFGNAEMSKKTQSLNEAYEILGDEEKRRQYDNHEHGLMDIPVQDIFNALFGMGGGGHGFMNQDNFSPQPQVHIFQTHHSHPFAHFFKESVQPIHCHVNVQLSKILDPMEVEVDVERIVQHETREHVLDKVKGCVHLCKRRVYLRKADVAIASR